MNAVLGDIAHVVVAMYMLYGKSTENIVIHPKGSYSTVIDYSTKTTYNLYNMEYDINHRFMNVKGDRKNFTKAISLLLEFVFFIRIDCRAVKTLIHHGETRFKYTAKYPIENNAVAGFVVKK